MSLDSLKSALAELTPVLKIMSLIPVTVGLLILSETFIPYKVLETVVTAKSKSFRAKTGTTTYSIQFGELNDQFTEEIFMALNENDQVRLWTTYFTSEIREIESLADGKTYANATLERYFLYGFAVAFLLSGLVWRKQGNLGKQQAFLTAIAILMSVVIGARIIFLQ